MIIKLLDKETKKIIETFDASIETALLIQLNKTFSIDSNKYEIVRTSIGVFSDLKLTVLPMSSMVEADELIISVRKLNKEPNLQL